MRIAHLTNTDNQSDTKGYNNFLTFLIVSEFSGF